MRNIQTAVYPHPLKTGHVFLGTYLLGIVHTTTSGNIYSKWNTLYIYAMYVLYVLYIFNEREIWTFILLASYTRKVPKI
jgi:hypothetical protein